MKYLFTLVACAAISVLVACGAGHPTIVSLLVIIVVAWRLVQPHLDRH